MGAAPGRGHGLRGGARSREVTEAGSQHGEELGRKVWGELPICPDVWSVVLRGHPGFPLLLRPGTPGSMDAPGAFIICQHSRPGPSQGVSRAGPLSGEVPEVSSGSWQRTPFLSPHLRVWGGGPLPGPGSWLPPSIFRSRDAAALPCDFLPRCPLPGPVTALTPRDLGLALGRPG